MKLHIVIDDMQVQVIYIICIVATLVLNACIGSISLFSLQFMNLDPIDYDGSVPRS